MNDIGGLNPVEVITLYGSFTVGKPTIVAVFRRTETYESADMGMNYGEAQITVRLK